MCITHLMGNIYNSKELKYTSRSVRCDRNAFHEKLDCTSKDQVVSPINITVTVPESFGVNAL